MLSHTSALLDRTENGSAICEVKVGISDGMELALFRAREALLAGWHLTPDEAMALVGPKAWKAPGNKGPSSDFTGETEDEVDDIPLYFSEG